MRYKIISDIAITACRRSATTAAGDNITLASANRVTSTHENIKSQRMFDCVAPDRFTSE